MSELRLVRVACLVLGLCCADRALSTEIYRWTDSSGRVHYSDRKPDRDAHETLQIDDVAPESPVPPGSVSSVAIERPATPGPPPSAPPPSVLMYSDPRCGYCRKAEQYFAARGIAWQSVDITASKQAREAFIKDGGRGTPLIFVNDVRVHGFNRARLDQLLARSGN